ncbi:hypothetical protein GQ600_4785 [Phytophthora cactorum]|nr:hypothetical protein GQ600_4785 [Phytophthora cactorum]
MDAGRAPASGLDGSNRYADTLKRYRLYDCSGVIRPLSDGEMRSWFERWRGTRGKRVTVARTVTQNSLNQAWASFVDCWSEETGAGFGRRSWREEPRMLACRWGTVSKGLRALARLAAAPEASVVLYAATTFGPWLPTSSGQPPDMRRDRDGDGSPAAAQGGRGGHRFHDMTDIPRTIHEGRRAVTLKRRSVVVGRTL